MKSSNNVTANDQENENNKTIMNLSPVRETENGKESTLVLATEKGNPLQECSIAALISPPTLSSKLKTNKGVENK